MCVALWLCANRAGTEKVSAPAREAKEKMAMAPQSSRWNQLSSEFFDQTGRKDIKEVLSPMFLPFIRVWKVFWEMLASLEQLIFLACTTKGKYVEVP